MIQYFAGKSTRQWETELVGGGVYWPPRLIPDSPGFHPALLGLEGLEFPFFFSFSFIFNPFFPIVMDPLWPNLLYSNLVGFFCAILGPFHLVCFYCFFQLQSVLLCSFPFHSLPLHSVSSPENQSPSVHSVTDCCKDGIMCQCPLKSFKIPPGRNRKTESEDKTTTPFNFMCCAVNVLLFRLA